MLLYLTLILLRFDLVSDESG